MYGYEGITRGSRSSTLCVVWAQVLAAFRSSKRKINVHHRPDREINGRCRPALA